MTTLRAIANAIGIEGTFLLLGIAGLTFVAWTLDPLLGVGLASVAAVAIGLILAPADQR